MGSAPRGARKNTGAVSRVGRARRGHSVAQPGGAGRPCWEDPIITYETVLALLDEAVLIGHRSAPEPEGVV
jgi:hypothetical protein